MPGTRKFSPGSSTEWNLPKRSTTHANCCGTTTTPCAAQGAAGLTEALRPRGCLREVAYQVPRRVEAREVIRDAPPRRELHLSSGAAGEAHGGGSACPGRDPRRQHSLSTGILLVPVLIRVPRYHSFCPERSISVTRSCRPCRRTRSSILTEQGSPLSSRPSSRGAAGTSPTRSLHTCTVILWCEADSRAVPLMFASPNRVPPLAGQLRE